LDGKYARSAAEADERVKAKNVKQTKKTLDKFKHRETQLIQSLTGLFPTPTDTDTAPTAQVVRVTRDMVDAGRRVLSIADCTGSSSSSTVVLTQDLSHLESKLPINEKAKSYDGDAENDVDEETKDDGAASPTKERSIYGLVKVFLSNLENCTVLVKCKIITGTIELHNCKNVLLKVEKEATVATIQADLSENITVEFHDAPSGKNMPGQKPLHWGDDKDDRIFHAGITNLLVRIVRDDFVESEITCDYKKDGAEGIGNATAEECQFITSVIDGKLVTEKAIRAGNATGKNVRAMTDRELQEERVRREKAATMAVAMAEDMIQIKDKDGNVLVKKSESDACLDHEKADDDGDVVEEVFTSHTPGAIKEILDECEILKTRGNEAFGAGEYGQAILHYSLCLDKASELPNARLFPQDVVYSNRAAAFLKLGQHDKAELDSQNALDINPDNIKALFRKGLALHASGRYLEALPVLARAHKVEPKNKQVKQALQFCEVRMEQERRKRLEG
jgi:hypothetical protein